MIQSSINKSDGGVYHLNLKPENITRHHICGDQNRVEKIT
jgi:uridine phosphorylase